MYFNLKSLVSLTSLCLSVYASVIPRHANWPQTPFKVDGPSIVDASGTPITYVGVNWPGAADVMIPEGLQYASVSSIVSKIRDLDMNVVRLTYAIEMIDDILDNGGDLGLADALDRALGSDNGSIVLEQILHSNPAFTAETTRLEIFDAVAEECANQQVYVHLDNHMSKGAWCCSLTDGNGWFGDTYFDVGKWKRGLAFMAEHAKSWTALTSMSLRNELRQVNGSGSVNSTYGWPLWYDEMTDAASGIHAANEDTLIFFSGLNYDTTLAPVTAGDDLGDGRIFNISAYDYAGKIVFELHDYENSATDCAELQAGLYDHGFNAMDTSSSTTAKNIAPVVLTEFGFAQNGTDYLGTYAQCLKDFVTRKHAGWMQWVLAGSYYIRSGTQDFDETWGLLDHAWNIWRDPTAVQKYTEPMVYDTY